MHRDDLDIAEHRQRETPLAAARLAVPAQMQGRAMHVPAAWESPGVA